MIGEYNKVMDLENIFSLKNFYVPKVETKKDLIKEILKEKNTFFKKNPQAVKENFTFKPTNFTKKLYERFLTTSYKMFGNFNLSNKNSKLCYVLCTNKNTYNSVPHHHINTSTINSVYYLNIPNTACEIKFLIDNKWISYQPSDHELLIFPNYLVHDTVKNNIKEWRISLNMEIICDFKWNTGKKNEI